MQSKALLTIAGVTMMLTIGAATAETTAQTTAQPPTAAPPATATASPPAAGVTPPAKFKKERSAESLMCSAEADKQNLHGAERKSFRKKCMKDAKAAAAAAETPAPSAPAVEPPAQK